MTDVAKVSCRSCRREIPSGTPFCPECGYTTEDRRADSLLKPIGLTLLMLGVFLLVVPTSEPRR